MLRLYLLLFIMGTLSAVAYGAYSYYINTQETIAVLRENNVRLEQANITNQATINRLQEEMIANARRQAELTTRLQEANQVVNGLRGRLAEIDITREALANPSDMEQRINRAVERLILNILEETGGEVVDSTDSSTSTE